jgi:hypothetical protein
MDLTADELAGVADLFGGLTRAELDRALAELAFRAGGEGESVAADVAAARRDYYLLEVDWNGESLLVPGPVAFPALPEGATDLPHILDVDDRSIPDEVLAERVRERLAADADEAVAEGDEERLATLVDATYDAEAWVAADLADVRVALERALE